MDELLFKCLLVDPYGNHNNAEAILIQRANYRAQASLLALENKTMARIREIANETMLG